MYAARFNLGNILTILALAGSFAVFLMRYSERISKIENVNEEQQHRIERAEGLVRDMYPRLERVNTNVDWIVKHMQEKKDNP